MTNIVKEPTKFSTDKAEIFYPEQLNILYSNHAFFTMTNTDFAIDFGIRHNQQIEDKPVAKTIMHTRIIMSPQQAKIFTKTINTLIEKYEKEFDEIKIK